MSTAYMEVSNSNSYVFSSVRQGDLVIRLSGNEAGLHAGYTVPESNALLSVTKEVFRLGGNNSNVSVSNNILQASNINFTGSLTQNGVPFVSGGGSVAGISNLSYETSNLMTFHVGSNTSNDGFRWLTGSGSNEVMSLTGDGKLFAGSILPSTTLTYDLGSSNNRWRDLYLSGNTINMGGVQLTADSNNNFMIMDSNNNLKTIMTGEVQIGQNTGIMSEHAGQIMFKSMGSNVMTLCNTMISLNTNFQVAAPLNLQGLQINRRGGNALNVSLQPQFISNGCNIYINSGSNFGIGTSLPTQALDVIGNIATGGVVRVTSGGALQNVTADATVITTGTVAIARLPAASTSASGIVQLTDSVSSTSTITAATPNSVKVVYDIASRIKAFGFVGSNGVGTGLNLSNVTYNGVGTYTVWYTNNIALPYSLLVTAERHSSGNWRAFQVIAKTSSNIQVLMYNPTNSTETAADWNFQVLQ